MLATVLALAAVAGAWATRAPELAPAGVVVARVSPPAVEPSRRDAGRHGSVPRVLQPDAERAGQIAGQLGEARFRLARAGARCDDAVLADAAERFAEARAAADDADWDELGAVLDEVLAALDECPAELGAVRARLRSWRTSSPFQ